MGSRVATRPTFTPPKTYTFRQLEELWIGAGGRKIAAPTAAAIALAESGGNPNSEGHNTNGSIDRGLWQINSVHGSLSTTDVVANVKAAVKIYNESGWSPWVTFKTGAYQAPLRQYGHTGVDLEKGAEGKGLFEQIVEAGGGANERVGFGAATNVGARAVGQPAPSQTVAKQVGGAEQKATGALEKFTWSGLSKIIVTAVLLIAGAVLVVYGIMVAVRPRESAFSVPLPKAVPLPI
jgi:hypothetical protein